MGKKSWAWEKIYLDDQLPEGNPFMEGLFQWMDSPEGELSEEARETVWALLDTMQIDVTRKTIIWSDGQCLDIDQTVRRLHEEHPQFPATLIEDNVISWLEMEYAPQDFSPTQLDELDRQIDRWINSHHRRSRRDSNR